METNPDNLAFRERLNECVRRCGNPNQLSKKSGLPISTIVRYFNGSEPTRPMLNALASAAGVSLEWLATGANASSSNATGVDAYVPTISEPNANMGDIVRIPRLLGSKREPDGNRPLIFAPERAFVPLGWISDGIKGAKPEDLALFRVVSDEMEPELFDGEILFVDTAMTARTPTEGTRLVRIYDQLCVRHVIRLSKDTFSLRHLKMPAALEGVRFSAEQLGVDIDILGRIIVALRSPGRS